MTQFARVPKEVIAAPVGHRAFRVLVGVIAHADKNGECHPSSQVLSNVTGVPYKHIAACLNELEDAGTIQRFRRDGTKYIRLVQNPQNGDIPDTENSPNQGFSGRGNPQNGEKNPRNGEFPVPPPITPLSLTEQTNEQREREAGSPSPASNDQPKGQNPKPEDLPRAAPDEARRVADRAERLFPMMEHGRRAADACDSYGTAWVDAALTAASDAKGPTCPWVYIRGILRGFANGEGPKPEAIKAATKRVADPNAPVVAIAASPMHGLDPDAMKALAAFGPAKPVRRFGPKTH